MSAQLIGTVTLAGALPGAATLEVGATAQLEAQIAGAIAAQARITITPPTLSASLTAALEIVASLQESIAIGLPTVNLQIAALVSLIAQLEAELAAFASLQLALGTSGVSVYSFLSESGQVGADLQAAIGAGPPGSTVDMLCGGIVLAATAPEARVAIGVFAGVSI